MKSELLQRLDRLSTSSSLIQKANKVRLETEESITSFLNVTTRLRRSVTEVQQTFIWGTTVNVEETMGRLRSFFREFTAPASEDEEGNDKTALLCASGDDLMLALLESSLEPFYPRMFEQLRATECYNLNLDCRNLYSYDPVVYKHLIRYPQVID